MDFSEEQLDIFLAEQVNGMDQDDLERTADTYSDTIDAMVGGAMAGMGFDDDMRKLKFEKESQFGDDHGVWVERKAKRYTKGQIILAMRGVRKELDKTWDKVAELSKQADEKKEAGQDYSAEMAEMNDVITSIAEDRPYLRKIMENMFRQYGEAVEQELGEDILGQVQEILTSNALPEGLSDEQKANIELCRKKAKEGSETIISSIAQMLGLDPSHGLITNLSNDGEMKSLVQEAVILAGEGQIKGSLGAGPEGDNTVMALGGTEKSTDAFGRYNTVLQKIYARVKGSAQPLLGDAKASISQIEQSLLNDIQPEDSKNVVLDKLANAIEAARRYGKFGKNETQRLESLKKVVQSSSGEIQGAAVKGTLERMRTETTLEPNDPFETFAVDFQDKVASVASFGSAAVVLANHYQHEDGQEFKMLDTADFFSKTRKHLEEAGINIPTKLTERKKEQSAELNTSFSTVFPFRNENIKKSWGLLKGLLDIWALQSAGFSEKQKAALELDDQIRANLPDSFWKKKIVDEKSKKEKRAIYAGVKREVMRDNAIEKEIEDRITERYKGYRTLPKEQQDEIYEEIKDKVEREFEEKTKNRGGFNFTESEIALNDILAEEIEADMPRQAAVKEKQAEVKERNDYASVIELDMIRKVLDITELKMVNNQEGVEEMENQVNQAAGLRRRVLDSSEDVETFKGLAEKAKMESAIEFKHIVDLIQRNMVATDPSTGLIKQASFMGNLPGASVPEVRAQYQNLFEKLDKIVKANESSNRDSIEGLSRDAFTKNLYSIIRQGKQAEIAIQNPDVYPPPEPPM
ncbi:MAG: hypothetical protein FWE31_02460 [Firmicutes bacterium]|nr:hypothetical protein [Bacillota bacterium]